MRDDDTISNTSGNRPFEDVLKVNLERRKVLKGGVALAAAGFLAPLGVAEAFRGRGPRGGGPLLGFTPIPVADGGGVDPNVAAEYEYDIILPWGDPLEPGGPAFSGVPVDPEAQALQLGIGHDGMWYFPMNGGRGGYGDRGRRLGIGPGNDHGLLCLNHEFGTNYHVLRKDDPESLEDVRRSQHAHGVSVVELKRSPGRHGRWRTVDGNYSRRIHVNTPMTFGGPAAGHEDLANINGNPALGTVNNCAYGVTPWDTYLTCEENFHGYFGTEDPSWSPSDKQVRLGFSNTGFGYGWHRFDKRFDLADPEYANEHNRFGWVVEVDPFDPTRTPVKRTALGRKKTEGATCHEAADGRVVVYMGDDERYDYIYKFVSADPWRTMRAGGESPLDRGTLYAARFNDDNTGEWLELSLSNVDILNSSAFADMGELLINVRLAADIAGATPMDRPEWCTVAPDGRVYFSLTNNSRRDGSTRDGCPTGQREINGRCVDSGPTPGNPLGGSAGGNADGHILRFEETRGHAGTAFEWDIFLISRDTHGTEESFSDPDGLWADPDGRLFIETDGGQKDGLNNQMLVADTTTGEIKRLFTGVPECEITGFAITPDRRTVFINVQHPGDGDPAVSNFPIPGAGGPQVPRDATIVITRKDGGIIGS